MISIIVALVLAGSAQQDTTRYVVVNHGRPAGHLTVERLQDSAAVHYFFIDRNRGTNVRSHYGFAADGTPRNATTWSMLVRETTPAGSPNARLRVLGDSVEFNSDRMLRQPGVWYWQTGGTPFDAALFARYLLRQPERTGTTRGGGRVRLETVAEETVSTSDGPARVRLVALHSGSGVTPSALWLDEADELFASQVGWFITVRDGAEGALPILRERELSWRNANAAAISSRARPLGSGTTAILHGDVFDAGRGVLLPRTSVLVTGDRITAVGPAESLSIPPDAHVIDAAGKAVLPGMWEMHGHLQHTSATGSAVQQLARGITTVRDLAADLDVAVYHRDRADEGALLSPRMILAGFIEGPGAWAGPSEAIAGNEAEARYWVARYDSLGYRQVKLYNLVHPDIVPVIVEEARARGMIVSGHVPRGLTLPAFVRLGANEINHAAFFFSTFFQDSLYVPEMRAYSAVAAQVAAHVDVDGPEMTDVIDVLARHGTVVDGTFSIWIREEGQGGPNVTGLPSSATDSLAAQSNASYYRLIRRLYDAGVTMVPGTDAGGGSRFIAELETYRKAGLPISHVLQMATIISARVMGEDHEYGSITPGKVADIIVVNGRPTEDLTDLRHVEYVLRAGRAYRAADLWNAIGMRPAAQQQ